MDAQHTKHVSQFVRCLFFVFLLVSSGFLNELLKPIVIQVSTVLPFLPALLSHPDFQEGIQDGVRIFQEGLFWEDHEKVWTEDEIITYIGEELSEEKYRREQRIDQVMGQPSLSYLYHLGFAISYLDQALAAQAQEGTVSEERQTHVVVLPEETCTVGRLCRTYPQRMARGRETVPSLSRANDMQQIITAKLKLLTTPEQLQALRETHLAYRDALNAVSSYAFEHGKTSNVTKLHKGMYAELRARYHLPSQLACSVERQVAATYKGLWTKLKKNVEHRNLERTYQHPLPGL